MDAVRPDQQRAALRPLATVLVEPKRRDAAVIVLLVARDTVIEETPASLATSLSVGLSSPLRRLRSVGG